MELEEYIQYNYNKKDDDLAKFLLQIINKLKNDENISNDIKHDVYVAYGMANGYVEYKARSLAQILGLTKTAVKYQTKQLRDKNKIKIIKENDITFLTLNIE